MKLQQLHFFFDIELSYKTSKLARLVTAHLRVWRVSNVADNLPRQKFHLILTKFFMELKHIETVYDVVSQADVV